MVFFLLGLSGFWGWQKARAQQVSKVVLANVSALNAGLGFFFNDYERYPKNSEFASPLFMQDYFSAFPPREFPSQDCEQSFKYQRTDLNSYSLSFCLWSAVENYRSGWNN